MPYSPSVTRYSIFLSNQIITLPNSIFPTILEPTWLERRIARHNSNIKPKLSSAPLPGKGSAIGGIYFLVRLVTKSSGAGLLSHIYKLSWLPNHRSVNSVRQSCRYFNRSRRVLWLAGPGHVTSRDLATVVVTCET